MKDTTATRQPAVEIHTKTSVQIAITWAITEILHIIIINKVLSYFSIY